MIIGNAIVLAAGGGAVLESLTATENGTYTPPAGTDGYSTVIVGVTRRSPRCDPVISFGFAALAADFMSWTVTAENALSAGDDETFG